MKVTVFKLESNYLCIGERIKGGVFRPCARTIRYSTITPALRQKFNSTDIYAVGHLIERRDKNKVFCHIYSPRDRFGDYSKIPITIEFLADVEAMVYVVKKSKEISFPQIFSISLGGLRSRGFGECRLTYQGEVESPVSQGLLNTRLPLKYDSIFGIEKIWQPVYGYLYEGESIDKGRYVPSLFEGSLITGPKFLLKEEYTWTLSRIPSKKY